MTPLTFREEAFAVPPVRFVALVIEPEKFPTKVVAVTTPVTLTFPSTVSFDVGFVVPIPTFESV